MIDASASEQGAVAGEVDAVVRAFADGALDAVIVADLSGRIVHWSPLAESMFGWSAAEVCGRAVGTTIVPERYRALHESGLARLAQSGRSMVVGRRLPLQAQRKDGRELSIELRISMVGVGDSGLLIAYLRDLTDQTRAESRTTEAEAFAESVLASLESLVAVVSRDGTILAVNDSWRRSAAAYGGSPGALGIGVNYLEACMRAREADAVAGKQAHVGILAVLDGVRARFTLEYACDGPDRRHWYSMVVTPLRAPWQGAVIAHTDITERRELEEALRVPARADVLTGLPNRLLFADRVEQALLRRERDGGKCALLFIDLDHFKEVNDTLGHSAGDALLCEVARRFQEKVRKSDTIARFGGDEFLVLLPEIHGNEAAAGVARKLLDALDAPFVHDGHALHAEASIGIVVAPDHGDDLNTLLRRADVAMYAAKRGRREYAFYVLDEDRVAAQRLTIASELRAAVGQNQLFLTFQPIVDVGSGEYRSVEALLRWQHPQHGLLEGKDFLPLAEQAGAARHVSRWALNEAVRACSAWNEIGLACGVSLNLALEDFRDGELPQVVASLLEKWRLPAKLLMLEIAARGALADPDLISNALHALDALGVRLVLDDFARGLAQLSVLPQLPAWAVKLDVSLLVKGGDGRAEEVVRTALDLARRLDLLVIADGIERSEQLDLAADLGCSWVQGSWISRAHPEKDFRAWLRARRTQTARPTAAVG